MGNNLFVTGFPYEMTQEDLGKLFAEFGTVLNVKILVERDTGRSRGIAFVLMATEAEADAAMKKLNGSMVGERKIFVIEAKPAEKAEAGYTGPERRSGRDRRRIPPAAAGASSARRPWEISALILATLISTYLRSISIPMNLRPRRIAATPVVPLPMNGSKIVF